MSSYKYYLIIKNNKIYFFFSQKKVVKLSDELVYGIKIGINLLNKLDIKPIIGLISGGRNGDIGRSKIVDETIKNTETIYNMLKKKDIEIKNYTILIEEAMKYSNYIITPDPNSCYFIVHTLLDIGKYKLIAEILITFDSKMLESEKNFDFISKKKKIFVKLNKTTIKNKNFFPLIDKLKQLEVKI